MTASFFDRYADNMAANGFRILPIGPGTKAPQRFNGSEWLGMSDWQRHGERDTRGFELAMWKRWPGAGIGIACGNVVGLDIDVTDAALAHRIKAMAFAELGETPLVRVGQEPKCILVYRADKPFHGRKRKPIELLAMGSQFVACAIHPVTGRPYQWTNEHPAETDVSALPEITEARALAFIDRAYDMVPVDMRPKRSLIGASSTVDASHTSAEREGTPEGIESALRALPNDDMDGASWILVCACIKAALGEDGRQTWLNWSKSSAKSGLSGKPDTAERRWETVRPHSVGAGTLYHLAREAGWVPEPHIVLRKSAVTAHAEGAAWAASLAKHAASGPPPEPANDQPEPRIKAASPRYKVPDSLFPKTGILADFVRYATDTAVSPQPFLALGAGIAMLAALAGRRYAGHTGLWTNFYGVGIADSGGGKDHARKCVKRLLFAGGLDRYIGGEELVSSAGLLTAMCKHPARIFQIDEFGKFLSKLTSPKTAHSQAEVLTTLTKLYTSSDDKFVGAEYADQSAKGRPRADIHNPCSCLWGTTVPGPLWQAIEGGLLSDGSMARFMFFLSDCNYPDQKDDPGNGEPPPELVDKLIAVTRGADGHSYGSPMADDLDAPMNYALTIKPYFVPASPDALACYRLMKDDTLSELRAGEGTYATALFARKKENALKLGLLAAISDNPANPVVTGAHAEWACALVTHCIETLICEAAAKAADTPAEARLKKVLRVIADHPPKIRKNDFCRRTQMLTQRERNEALVMLIESGQVGAIEAKSSTGRPVTYYAILEPDENKAA